MLRARKTLAFAALLTTVAVTAAWAVPSADASRRPSRAGAVVIKEIALAACSVPNRPCRFLGSRISTRNARFAWANVVGEGFSGVLLKRPRATSLRFRVVGTQGGGIGECSYWRARAPADVLRDLKISGLLGDSNAVGNCG